MTPTLRRARSPEHHPNGLGTPEVGVPAAWREFWASGWGGWVSRVTAGRRLAQGGRVRKGRRCPPCGAKPWLGAVGRVHVHWLLVGGH